MVSNVKIENLSHFILNSGALRPGERLLNRNT